MRDLALALLTLGLLSLCLPATARAAVPCEQAGNRVAFHDPTDPAARLQVARAEPVVNSPCPNGVCQTPAQAAAAARIIGYRQECNGNACTLVPVYETKAPALAVYPRGCPTAFAATGPDGTTCVGVARVAFWERGPARRGARRAKTFLFGD